MDSLTTIADQKIDVYSDALEEIAGLNVCLFPTPYLDYRERTRKAFREAVLAVMAEAKE